jgi:hypothetical protein
MHKLLLVGLVFAGVLSIRLVGPARAMQPASSADLRGCLGQYAEGGSCFRAEPCGTLANSFCIGNNYGCIYIMAGAEYNVECETPYLANGCTGAGTGAPCEVYQVGTCSVNEESGEATCNTDGKNLNYGTYDLCGHY